MTERIERQITGSFETHGWDQSTIDKVVLNTDTSTVTLPQEIEEEISRRFNSNPDVQRRRRNAFGPSSSFWKREIGGAAS